MCMHCCTDGEKCLVCGEPTPNQFRVKTEIGEETSCKPLPANETLLETAIEILHDVESEEIETIQISSTKYDDGSRGLSIEITYPPELTELEKQAKEVYERLKDNLPKE